MSRPISGTVSWRHARFPIRASVSRLGRTFPLELGDDRFRDVGLRGYAFYPLLERAGDNREEIPIAHDKIARPETRRPHHILTVFTLPQVLQARWSTRIAPISTFQFLSSESARPYESD
jgi:hypothetical protein